MNTRHLLMIALCCITALAVPSVDAARSDIGYPRIMQGPMAGPPFPEALTVWVRVSGAFPVQLEVADNPDMTDSRMSPVVNAEKADDYCVVLTMDGLQPGTDYFYRVYVNESVDRSMSKRPAPSLRTAPTTPSRFTVAFGSCGRVQEDPHQPIWSALQRYEPDLFFWLGDNIYGDVLDTDILAEEYRRQREVLTLQPLNPVMPQLAVWDDHDYGLNDHDRTNPVKQDALRVFQQYWPNPSYGLSNTPGVFFAYSYGGVDFIFLDGRYYRDPNHEPDHAEKTMLGTEQLAWAKEQLKSSDAVFKVLICGSGFTDGKGPGGDSWASFATERDSILQYIVDEEIEGVVLMSGDTHLGELNVIPWGERGGYDFYEFVSSPLAQSPSLGWFGRAPYPIIRTPYSLTPNAGIIEFDLTGEPTLRFNLIDIYGETVYPPFVLKASELKNGISGWKDKVDRNTQRVMEIRENGSGQ